LLSSTKNKPTIGVDIVLFDFEDSGSSEDTTGMSWALGSQYWAAHLMPENYRPFYGILLDMVGAKGATFPTEGTSMQYAPAIVRNVWSIASELGYNNYFIVSSLHPYVDCEMTPSHLQHQRPLNLQLLLIVHYLLRIHVYQFVLSQRMHHTLTYLRKVINAYK